ncbi:MAG: hypothetical protein JWN30_439 [Bacilli bacterium]|nr:hypothetical protein [Bacilli bacterium]
MVRNKDNHPGNFGGSKHLEFPKAESAHAPLRPDGTTAPDPAGRMWNGAQEHIFHNPPQDEISPPE